MTAGELCRTLIVDDEILIRQGIKHYINWEQEGFLIVGEASNGQEALELIEAAHPHIIITDIVMPIMDGEELTKIVKEKYPHIEIIILSSFGEFDYVRSTFQSGVVDYILKPKLDAQGLLKALKTAASRIPSFKIKEKDVDAKLSIGQIIDKLISGYEANYDLQSVTRAFPYSHYCLLGADVKSYPSRGAAALIKRKIGEALNLYMSSATHYSFSFDQNVIGFLINADKHDMDKAAECVKQFAESEPHIGFVLTESFEDISQIGDVYKESLLKLLNYRFYFPDYPLLTKQNLPEVPAKCDNFNLDWFTGEIKLKRFDSAFRYIRDYARTLASCYTKDIFEYKAFFSNLIFNITLLLRTMEYDVKELENAKYSYFKFVDETRSASETIAILDRFIKEANTCIFSMQNQPGNPNMKKIMQYIMEHYAEPLTLTDVAKHFHFNPSYLSSYFSANSGEGFIEYLNKVRIEEAAKLLTKSTAPISEISGMVGYSDHSYFCKVFKKMKGVSPSQYRRKQNLG